MDSQMISVAIQVLALLLAVSVHESAHGWVAWRWGDSTAKDLGRITINPLRHMDLVGSVLVPAVLAFSGGPVFGWAKPVPISLGETSNPRVANFWIALAGPASNLVFAALMSGVVLGMRDFAVEPTLFTESFRVFAIYAVLINVILAVFNLLPIPPLDGFGVVESLVPPAWLKWTNQLRRYGMLLLLGVIFSGILSDILGPAQRAVLKFLGV